MKFSVALVSAALFACTSARTLGVDVSEETRAVTVEPRAAAANTSANDLIATGNFLIAEACKDVILVFARGTKQSGNLGEMPAPDLVAQLNTALGSSVLAVQGDNYAAALLTNMLPGGCNPQEAAAMAKLITNATTTCPDSKVVVGGYSQGSALVHGSISQLNSTVTDRISAAVLFGDTQFQQTGGVIKNFDPAKTLIMCNTGDLVCNGTLIITNAHTNYLNKVPQAVSFIQSKIA